MSDLNEFTATGRLVEDPDLRYTAEGTALARFRLAVNGVPRKDREEQETLFIPVTAWGKLAETLSEYARKGHRIGVSGKLKLNSWTTQDGQKRQRIELALRRAVFLEPKKADGGAQHTMPPEAHEPESEEVPF